MKHIYTCDILFKGPEAGISKLLENINQSVSTTRYDMPNLLNILDKINFDYIGYSEFEKEKLWDEYKKRGGGFNDFMHLYKENLKTNFNVDFYGVDYCGRYDDNDYYLSVGADFYGKIDPRVMFLLAQNYGLTAYQYTGYNQTKLEALKGSYNDNMPEETTIVIKSDKPDGDGSFIQMCTDSELEKEREKYDDSRYYIFEVPIQPKEEVPLVYGMFNSSDVYID